MPANTAPQLRSTFMVCSGQRRVSVPVSGRHEGQADLAGVQGATHLTASTFQVWARQMLAAVAVTSTLKARPLRQAAHRYVPGGGPDPSTHRPGEEAAMQPLLSAQRTGRLSLAWQLTQACPQL